ncbi:MAG TPA: ATP-binding cassette domain-containing protein [Streptosporangiaceae bacterium]
MAIELRHIKKDFGLGQGQRITAADDVTFTVEAGEFVALTGASGSGKSTLLHTIGAIERPDSGTIVSAGIDITQPARGGARRLPAHGRVRVPAVQPAARAHRARQRARAGPAVPDQLEQAGAGHGTARGRRPGRSRAVTPVPDVRRRTAAGRDRARPDQHATSGARRRADRDGAVVDDLKLTGGYPPGEIIRRAGQLG